MKHLGLLLEVGLQEDLIGLLLGFGEDDRPAVSSSIEVDNVGNDGVAVVVGTVESEVLDGLGGPDFGILDEVDELSVG